MSGAAAQKAARTKVCQLYLLCFIVGIAAINTPESIWDAGLGIINCLFTTFIKGYKTNKTNYPKEKVGQRKNQY